MAELRADYVKSQGNWCEKYLQNCWERTCFSPDGCASQSSKFTYGHRRLLVVGAGPGDEEP